MSWEERFTDLRAELRACQRAVDQFADEAHGLAGAELNAKRAKVRNTLMKVGQGVSKLAQAAKHVGDPAQQESMEKRVRQLREQRQAMLDKIGGTGEAGLFTRLKGALGVGGNHEEVAEEPMFDDQDDEQLLMMQNGQLAQQDEALARLHNVIVRQKEVSIAIGDELDEQAPIVDQLSRNVERNKTTLQAETRRVHQILEAKSDSRLTYCIWLLLLAFGVVVVFALS